MMQLLKINAYLKYKANNINNDYNFILLIITIFKFKYLYRIIFIILETKLVFCLSLLNIWFRIRKMEAFFEKNFSKSV